MRNIKKEFIFRMLSILLILVFVFGMNELSKFTVEKNEISNYGILIATIYCATYCIGAIWVANTLNYELALDFRIKENVLLFIFISPLFLFIIAIQPYGGYRISSLIKNIEAADKKARFWRNNSNAALAYLMAVAALENVKDTRLAGPMIKELARTNNHIQHYILTALKRMNGPQLVPILIESLKSRKTVVRVNAAKLLGESREPLAQEDLKLLLNDTSTDVQEAARQALATLTTLVQKTIRDLPIAIIRGGVGEPYCSHECYDKGGKYVTAVMLNNQTGVCGFCKTPVQASMYGAANCAVVPYENVNLFVCKSCIDQGQAYLRDYRKCCMCQKSL